MMMNPLPNIDKAFSLVIQQEREMALTVVVDSTEPEPAPTALHVNSQNLPNGKDNQFNKWKGFNS